MATTDSRAIARSLSFSFDSTIHHITFDSPYTLQGTAIPASNLTYRETRLRLCTESVETRVHQPRARVSAHHRCEIGKVRFDMLYRPLYVLLQHDRVAGEAVWKNARCNGPETDSASAASRTILSSARLCESEPRARRQRNPRTPTER